MSEEYYLDDEETFNEFLLATNWDELEVFVRILSCQKPEVYEAIMERFNSFKTDPELQQQYEHYFPMWDEFVCDEIVERSGLAFSLNIDDAHDGDFSNMHNLISEDFMDGFSWDGSDSHIYEGCKLASEHAAKKTDLIFYMATVYDEDHHAFGFIKRDDIGRFRSLPMAFIKGFSLYP